MPHTKYFNEYSPQNGLIAALFIRKAAGETVYWSDVAFAMWEAVTSFSGTNIKNLRFIAQHAISNAFTQSIIQRLVEGEPGQVKMYGQDAEAFLALLGTPNGAGGVHLLMQHKRQLGFKTVAMATVFGKSPDAWFNEGPDVVFQLRDMPVPRISGAAATNACHLLNSSSSEALSET